MKSFIEIISSVKDVSHDKFPSGLSLLLVLFFISFGAASLFLLLNCPA